MMQKVFFDAGKESGPFMGIDRGEQGVCLPGVITRYVFAPRSPGGPFALELVRQGSGMLVATADSDGRNPYDTERQLIAHASQIVSPAGDPIVWRTKPSMVVDVRFWFWFSVLPAKGEESLTEEEHAELVEAMRAVIERRHGWTRKMQDAFVLGWLLGIGIELEAAYLVLARTRLSLRSNGFRST